MEEWAEETVEGGEVEAGRVWREEEFDGEVELEAAGWEEEFEVEDPEWVEGGGGKTRGAREGGR